MDHTCPTCGRTVRPGQTTCPGCGSPLPVIARGAAPPTLPQVVAAPGLNLVKIAVNQRRLVICVLLSLLNYGLPMALTSAGIAPPVALVAHYAIALGLTIFGIVAAARLSNALRAPVGWTVVGCILMVCGCLGLLVMLMLSQRATRALRKNGVRVGLLGADPAEALLAMSENHCKNCRYDLTGNLTGVCPECGTPRLAGA